MKEISQKISRGKTANGKWVEGYLTEETVCTIYDTHLVPVIREKPKGIYHREQYEVIPETIGPCTDLTDKNGNMIFKGDIVRILGEIVGVITFECGAYGIESLHTIDYDYLASQIRGITGCDNRPYFCYNDNFVSLWELCWNFNQDNDCLDIVEIIGNIHDNPIKVIQI